MKSIIHQANIDIKNEPESNVLAWNECGTDADTCCLGQNFVIYQRTNRTAEVYSYDPKAPPKTVPIVTGATCYDDPISGESLILLFHESLYYGRDLTHSLVNPNQIRYNGIPTWDNPLIQNEILALKLTTAPLFHSNLKVQKYISDHVLQHLQNYKIVEK